MQKTFSPLTLNSSCMHFYQPLFQTISVTAWGSTTVKDINYTPFPVVNLTGLEHGPLHNSEKKSFIKKLFMFSIPIGVK